MVVSPQRPSRRLTRSRASASWTSSRNEIEVGLLVRRAPRVAVELAHVTGCELPLRQIGRQDGGARDRPPKRNQRDRGFRGDDLLLDLGGDFDRAVRHPERVGLELLAGDLIAQRKHEAVEEILHQRQPELVRFAVVQSKSSFQPERGVPQQAGLDYVRLGDAESLVRGLQVGRY